MLICVQCRRPMYTTAGDVDTIIAAVGLDSLIRDYGYRSEWEPTMCRRCDVTHDHRYRPSWWRRWRIDGTRKGRAKGQQA